MLVFWRHGYEASSLNDLTAAMGITPPSLYAAYGDKRRLFLEAVRRYLRAGGTTPEEFIDGSASARAAAAGLLEGAATAFTGTATPAGCLLATSAISVSTAADDVRAEMAAIRRGIEDHLRRRIERDVAEATLTSDVDAATSAGLIMALIQGMSTLARDGASREHLSAVARMALRDWPPAPGGASGDRERTPGT